MSSNILFIKTFNPGNLREMQRNNLADVRHLIVEVHGQQNDSVDTVGIGNNEFINVYVVKRDDEKAKKNLHFPLSYKTVIGTLDPNARVALYRTARFL